MTGREIKRQVMEALPVGSYGYHARAALAPCVVLTPEGDWDEVDEALGWVKERTEALASVPHRFVRQPGTGMNFCGYRGCKRTIAEHDEWDALLTPDPKIFAPRDPHTYVTHEPPSSGAGEGVTQRAVESPAEVAATPAPEDDIGPPDGDDHYLDGVPDDVHKQTGGPC